MAPEQAGSQEAATGPRTAARPARHRRKRLLVLAVAVLVVLLVGAVAVFLRPLGPMPAAVVALSSTPDVVVEDEAWLTFTPTDSSPDVGLILYPGGRVRPASYAPAAGQIGRAGYLVVIVPMPLNLAVLGSGRAQDVIDAHPEISSWAVGGHSLGGAMAARYADDNPDVAGVVLWAAYPGGGTDLSDDDLHVVSISGSHDRITTPEEVRDSRARLPSAAVFVEIAGGNHAQFGWYGDQAGDGPAGIGRPEQQAAIVRATVRLLEALPGQ